MIASTEANPPEKPTRRRLTTEEKEERDRVSEERKRARELNNAELARVDEFVVKIAAAWQKAVSSIIETGQLLVEAKATLEHGHWGAMIEAKLPFSARTAQILMQIAEHPILSNPKFVSHLPPSWGALHELCAIKDEDLLDLMSRHEIHPEMTRNDVRRLFYTKWDEVMKGMLALFEFMERMEPEQLAPKLLTSHGHWTFSDDHLRLLPNYFEYLCKALVELRKSEAFTPPEVRRLTPWQGDPISEDDIEAARAREKERERESAAVEEELLSRPPTRRSRSADEGEERTTRPSSRASSDEGQEEKAPRRSRAKKAE